MQFSINKRDGTARVGELILEDKKILTPNILFIDTSRIKAPGFAECLITNKNSRTEKISIAIGKGAFSSSFKSIKGALSTNNFLVYPKDVTKELHLSSIGFNKKIFKCYITPANKDVIEDAIKENDALIFIVANALQMFSQHSKFVDFIIDLRREIGYQKLMYVPSIGFPSNFALLSYMGVDLFDSSTAINAARNDIILFPTGNIDKNEIDEIHCSCPICHRIKGNVLKMDFNMILNHNYFTLANEIKQVRNAVSLGCLRELVENRVRCDPNLLSILRILDFQHYLFLEKRTPIIRKKKLIATSKESLFRPEIKRFQDRLLNRYQKPNCAKVLLLLPCSAKKPYSFSKSHRLFRDILHGVKNPFIVHEVIVTSPLGVVPRELEIIYPASKYDIAVTGYWDEDEKKMIRYLLKCYLDSNVYDSIVLHLPLDIQEFVLDLLKNPIKTCIGKPTSKESITELFKVLKKKTIIYDFVKPSKRAYENVKGLASYQFGKEIAEKFLIDCSIKGKYPYQKIMYNNKQLGMITLNRGLISLTLEGGKRLAEYGKYWVEIYDDFELKGSLFAPGIKDSDESIRIGDEVIILKNIKVCAVGVAQMNGEEMRESLHGEAVKIRHRI